MKKLLSCTLAVLMLSAALTGCSSLTSTPSGSPGDKASAAPGDTPSAATSAAPADSVTVALTIDPESFNPWLMAQDSRQQVYYNTIYEPLARLNFEGQRELVLAKSVEQSEPGCYAIELYDNIFDSAGNQITASDVVFSFNKCIEMGQLAWGTRYLDRFEQTGDDTLLMYTKDESAVALDMLLKTVFIVSEKSYNASSDGFATTPVGSGPYTLQNYVPGSSVTIAARDNYWQTDPALVTTSAKLNSVKTVNFKVITEPSQLALALEMGEVDCVTGTPGISNADYANFMDEERNPLPGYNVSSYINALVYHLEYNCGAYSPLKDQKVREAVSYAIDMDAIVASVFGKDAVACATNSSPYYSDYDDSLVSSGIPFAYDAEKAKTLLHEAGYEDGQLSLKLIAQNTDEFTKVATLIQAYLNAVGVNVDVKIYENALFNTTRSDTKGDQWDLCLNCVMGLNSPGRLGVLDKNAYMTGMNGLYLDDAKLQDLYLAANLAATYSVDTVTQLLQYVQDNCYLYPLYYKMGYSITTDKITDIVLDRNNALIPGASTIYAK